MLVAGQTDMTKRSLDAVATALMKRGFQRVERTLLSPDGRPSKHVAVVWLDPQGNGRWVLHFLGQVALLLASLEGINDNSTKGRIWRSCRI